MLVPGNAKTQEKIEYQTQYEALAKENVLYADREAVEESFQRLLAAARRAAQATGNGACSCVLYARALTGYPTAIGYAYNWPVNSQIPVIGGVVVFNIGPYGHVAVIDAINVDSFHVKESNYKHCQFTQRWIPFSDPTIKGYYSPL